MRKFKTLPVVAFALLAILSLFSAAPAQAREPKYLHAISDLRTARALMKMELQTNHWPGVEQSAWSIIGQLDKAIDEMTRAAGNDGKDTWHEPPPQSSPDPYYALHSAEKLIREARHDVEEGEDIPQNTGLQIRSLERMDRALEFLHSWINSGKGQ